MNKNLRRITVLLLVVALMFANAITLSVVAVDDDDTELIPIRTFFEDAGASVEWHEELRAIEITYGPYTYILFVDSPVAYVNNAEVSLQSAIIILQDRSYISLQDLETLLTMEFGYLGATINAAALAANSIIEHYSVAGITIAIVDAQEGFTWTGGFGYANVESGAAVDEFTLFNLASISKTFTATAIMQLVEEGIIDLDEPVSTYLPDFTLPTDVIVGEGDYRSITPRMLISHASGMYADIMASGVITRQSPNPEYMNDFLDMIADYPMAAPEGTVFSYANNSYTLLGVLVAGVMGYDSYFEGFAAYMQEYIFEPAGMDLTTFILEDRHMPYLAQPYADATALEEYLYYNALPAGGILSNANDMARFMHILLSGGALEDGANRILSSDSVRQMFELQDFNFEAEFDFLIPNMRPGLGILDQITLGGFTYSGHPGNLVHYHSDMAFDTGSGLGVFVSVNSISGMEVVKFLSELLLQTAVLEKTGTVDLPQSDLSVEPISLSSEDLEALEGIYAIIGAEGLGYVTVLDDVLYFDLPIPTMPDPVALTALSDGSFIYLDAGLRIWFDELDGETVVYVGEFMTHLMGTRLSDEYIAAIATEDDVSRWIGSYRAVEEGNHVSLISDGFVAIDDNGFAYIMLNALHGQVVYSLLVQYEGNNYSGVEFIEDGDEIWIEFSGVRMIMID